MKRIIILVMIVFLISSSYSYNGFCFAPKISGITFNSWNGEPVNMTLYISSNYGEKPNGYPPYCMTNVSKIKIDSTGNFKISGLLVASPDRNCSLKIYGTKFGYIKYEKYIIINANQTNYNLSINLDPNLIIKFFEYGTNKMINGTVYLNGQLNKIKNGMVKFPLNQSLLYVFYNGDNEHDKSSRMYSIDNLWKENKINFTVYKKPRVIISLEQDKNITNSGQEVNVELRIKNLEKFSSPISVSYKLDGCGINDSGNVSENKVIKYKIYPKENCTISINYLIFDEISKSGQSGTKSIEHHVSNKLNIIYWTKNGYIYARVLDVNGNPIKTNLTIRYNGKRIPMKLNGSLYYSKVPGNKFSLIANDSKNSGVVGVTGNFIKKNSKLNWKIIVLETILSGVTVFWILKVRIIKRKTY